MSNEHKDRTPRICTHRECEEGVPVFHHPPPPALPPDPPEDPTRDTRRVGLTPRTGRTCVSGTHEGKGRTGEPNAPLRPSTPLRNGHQDRLVRTIHTPTPSVLRTKRHQERTPRLRPESPLRKFRSPGKYTDTLPRRVTRAGGTDNKSPRKTEVHKKHSPFHFRTRFSDLRDGGTKSYTHFMDDTRSMVCSGKVPVEG